MSSSSSTLPSAPTPFREWTAAAGAPYPAGGVTFRDRRGAPRVLWGGSFWEAPSAGRGLHRVNLMAEQAQLPADLLLAIPDYQVPSAEQIPQMIALFEQILDRPYDTYVGCFGGKGRTGTVLGAFLTWIGAPDPIGQIRRQLHPEAGETRAQEAFVRAFPRRAPRADDVAGPDPNRQPLEEEPIRAEGLALDALSTPSVPLLLVSGGTSFRPK